MKILAFTDTHGSMRALRQIARDRWPNVLVCCGDLTVFEQDLARILRLLGEPGRRVLVVPGNHESPAGLRKAAAKWPNITVMHPGTYTAGDIVFFGYGVNGFALTDPGFEKAFASHKKGLKGKRPVLLSHAPPYGTRLDKVLDTHCGSRSLRKAIIQVKPSLVLCGHIHENQGKADRIGRTRVLNPGPFGMRLEI